MIFNNQTIACNTGYHSLMLVFTFLSKKKKLTTNTKQCKNGSLISDETFRSIIYLIYNRVSVFLEIIWGITNEFVTLVFGVSQHIIMTTFQPSFLKEINLIVTKFKEKRHYKGLERKI